MQNFKFHGESLTDSLKALSNLETPRNFSSFSMRCIVVEILESDSRSGLDSLVVSFCSKLESFGIQIKGLRFEVRSDTSGWAFFRFTSTQKKTKIISNGVEIKFPPNSTVEARMVAIETHSFRKDITLDINVKKGISYCEFTPLVCIDQQDDKLFLRPVSVVFPYPDTDKKISTRMF